jgi:hypothetical protein
MKLKIKKRYPRKKKFNKVKFPFFFFGEMLLANRKRVQIKNKIKNKLSLSLTVIVIIYLLFKNLTFFSSEFQIFF